MKVEHINPFLEAVQNVAQSLLSVDATMGKVYVKPSPYFTSQVIVVIGVVGGFKGQIYFEMSLDTAKSIAGCMLGGVSVDEFNELAKSAVSEMGNMIMGQAGILFERQGILIDLTPPSLITGNKIEISNKMPAIVIPLQMGNIGSVVLNVAVE